MRDIPIISSTSIDENTGIARIIIEGNITVPHECDNPVIELFRPIRAIYVKEMFFTILFKATPDTIIVTIMPSNRHDRPINEFLSTAIELLEGSDRYPGVIRGYVNMLNDYFCKPAGLQAYLEKIKAIEEADESMKSARIQALNNSIKDFVAEEGLIMPSFKKLPRPKKTKAEKKAAAAAYLEKHPEIKKPAN
ncbi:hypothetical protein IKD82_01710 [Candidatus Saccharibacteria bacterium]|nr:hypothetical protein [Candidatus Saccharibacteria bacterium]